MNITIVSKLYDYLTKMWTNSHPLQTAYKFLIKKALHSTPFWPTKELLELFTRCGWIRSSFYPPKSHPNWYLILMEVTSIGCYIQLTFFYLLSLPAPKTMSIYIWRTVIEVVAWVWDENKITGTHDHQCTISGPLSISTYTHYQPTYHCQRPNYYYCFAYFAVLTAWVSILKSLFCSIMTKVMLCLQEATLHHRSCVVVFVNW